jgi:DNA gyrase inhibitor GyrI
MSRMKIMGTLVLMVAVIGFFAWQLFAYRAPEPKYTIVAASGPIEVREYPQLVVAEVAMQGDRLKAINAGFKVLADYIFGDNKAKQKIAMTVPVTQQGAKVNMSAPVIQQQDGDGWLVRFVMPANSSKKTLPKPDNEEVVLTILPPTKYAVIRFSGRNTDTNMQVHLKELQQYVQEHKLKVNPTPIMAFYNPPWILPIFRRNEIMLQVKN